MLSVLLFARLKSKNFGELNKHILTTKRTTKSQRHLTFNTEHVQKVVDVQHKDEVAETVHAIEQKKNETESV